MWAHSLQFFAGRDLAGLQKGFDKFAFPASSHARESFEPFAVGHFGFGVQPIRQEAKLVGTDIPLTDSVKQVVEQPGRKTVAADARHGYSP